jgi:KipI family sensor histidine kinase inhibitor
MHARPAGDAALLVQADDLAGRLAAAVMSAGIPGVLNVIPGARTVLVTTEPGCLDLAELAARVLSLPLPAAWAGRAAPAEFPVVYDGPDLADVARLTGLTVDEVIARHAAAEYTVGWMGFSPGFGYLTGLDPALAAVPRLAEPRLRVPAGTVAIAGGLAAVYSSASPGGWRLLGRTSAVLWDPERDPPALLAPGTRVRFRPVDPGAASPPPPAASPPPPADPSATSAPSAAPAPGPLRHLHDRGGLMTTTAPHQPRSWKGTPIAAASGPGARAGDTVIEVVRPGPLATVQDLGRPGLGHLGVPCSGAADAASLRLANRLVGNPEGAAGLELTLGRAALRFSAAAWVAVTGASAKITLNAGPGAAPDPPGSAPDPPGGGAAREVGHGSAFWVPAGGLVQVGAPDAGLRSYLAVRGGIDVPPVLGSRSADLRSGLGPAPLRAGDLLPVGPLEGPPPHGQAFADEAAAGAAGPAAGGDAAAAGQAAPLAPTIPIPGEAAELRVIPGPRDDWFGPGALDLLCGADYAVTPASDRTGLRLDGPALSRARDDELASEGMVTGALQVPPGGQPILLLADHPVTGGYPVIAVVTAADIGLAAQLRPGSRVRFAVSRG